MYVFAVKAFAQTVFCSKENLEKIINEEKSPTQIAKEIMEENKEKR